MAKSKPRAPNTRAARRAASPSLDVDRSLTSAPRAESPTVQRPSILADRASSGIQKKQKNNQKKLSRAQRLRQQKGMDRAEAVFDQLEIKKSKSIGREKNTKARRAEWEDLNKKAARFAALQQDDAAEDDDDEDNDEMTDTAPAQVKPNPFAAHSTNVTAEDPALIDEDNEIT
ncbi:hypothetical protein N7478_004998 [Penicillium angulare]|uniref:uncharacterized protein n=1 Tax=Penicillium angulare TaxID=116970 RepID=UPI00254201E0|nr:uncharacterized protein N7478_004998 [Penicillium angulare]KAJ5279626.1 hypothetical protein N7478_004998 [Penicillium angulare]